jgi:hypothetical protein
MRTDLAGYSYAACPSFMKQSHASGGCEVLAMNRMIAKFHEQNVAHHDRFFACSRPAW